MLDHAVYDRLDALLAADDEERARLQAGLVTGRQPVHTVYVPADRFDSSTVTKWGAQALQVLDEYGPLPDTDDALADRVRHKLLTEPIEDLRVDFEDGYGIRDDDVEDAAARAAGSVIGGSLEVPFVGVRVKSLEGATRHRAVRTLDLVLAAASDAGRIPDGFRVTLPKVTSVAQVEAMVELCAALEDVHGLARLAFEIQIETPSSVLGGDGTALVARMVRAAEGRCGGLHYGTYDYSTSLGIGAPYQSMEHPVADHAKGVMLVAAAAAGVRLSDGSTNVLPVGNATQIRAAWMLHRRLVRRSLERGFYQGWDLHPAQLPTRFAATIEFFRADAAATSDRLLAYLYRREGSHLDEPATARAMAAMLVRGLDCGALEVAELDAWLGGDALGVLTRAGYRHVSVPNDTRTHERHIVE